MVTLASLESLLTSITRGSSEGQANSKIRTKPSCPPVAILLESCEKSIDLTMCLWSNLKSSEPVMASHTRAVKSPEAVAASKHVELHLALQTAPLCPANEPIQSPVVAFRSIGVLSWHAEIRKVPSDVLGVNWSSAIGRVCPGRTIGICRACPVIMINVALVELISIPHTKTCFTQAELPTPTALLCIPLYNSNDEHAFYIPALQGLAFQPPTMT